MKKANYNPTTSNYSITAFSSMLASGSTESSVCSTPMLPAGRQTFPIVAFQRRTRPSFPADDKTVLHIPSAS